MQTTETTEDRYALNIIQRAESASPFFEDNDSSLLQYLYQVPLETFVIVFNIMS